MPTAKNPTTRTRSSREVDQQSHLEDLLDEALEETFPASDPIAPSGQPGDRDAAGGSAVVREQPEFVASHKSGSVPIGPVGLDPVVSWDADQEIFRVRVHHSPTFAELVILKNAPLPLAHLDTSAHNRKTALGSQLHSRLEAEVNAAIARGGHQVATGIFLVTPEEKRRLPEHVRR